VPQSLHFTSPITQRYQFFTAVLPQHDAKPIVSAKAKL